MGGPDAINRTVPPGFPELTRNRGTGFNPADALHFFRAYYGFLYGHILNELQEDIADPDENEAIFRLGLHRLPAKEFLHFRALGPFLAEYDGDVELDQGQSILLSSLATQLSGPRPKPLA